MVNKGGEEALRGEKKGEMKEIGDGEKEDAG